MHITFRPFTRQEFSRYEEWSIGSYAEALIRSGTETEAEAPRENTLSFSPAQ